MSFRRVRSPDAPKMTTAHASPARSSTRPFRRGFCTLTLASSCLLHGVSAELVAKGGDDAQPERIVLARCEAGEERRGHRRRRDRVLDALLDGPASFAGVVDVCLEPRELRILRERALGELEEPRT